MWSASRLWVVRGCAHVPGRWQRVQVWPWVLQLGHAAGWMERGPAQRCKQLEGVAFASGRLCGTVGVRVGASSHPFLSDRMSVDFLVGGTSAMHPLSVPFSLQIVQSRNHPSLCAVHLPVACLELALRPICSWTTHGIASLHPPAWLALQA